MIIQQLLCIYNYIPVQQPPLIEISLQLVQNYPPIQKMLRRLCYQNNYNHQTLQNTYFLLNQFIMKQQQTLGPKRFKKLIQNIFTILTQYVLNLLRSPQQQKQQLFFNLTYYKKNCSKYIDNYYQCCIYIFYIIGNFQMNQVNSVEEKISQVNKKINKFKHKYFIDCVRCFSLIVVLGWVILKRLKTYVLKYQASQVCNQLNAQNKENSHHQLLNYNQFYHHQQYPKFIKYWENINYTHSQQINVYTTHKYIQDNKQFLKFLNIDKMEMKQMKIKLTRLQQKIRRVKLIQEEEIKKQQQRIKSKTIFKNYKINQLNINVNQKLANYVINKNGSKLTNDNNENRIFNNVTNKLVFPKDKPLPKKTSTFHYATLRSNLKTGSLLRSGSVHKLTQQSNQLLQTNKQLISIKQKGLNKKQILKLQRQKQQQLKNLLIIKDKKKNYYKLKQQTLKYLNKENNKLKKQIKIKDKQIQKINQQKQIISNQYNVEVLKDKIEEYHNYQVQLIKQIQGKKWNYLEELPAVKKINTYFKTFFQQGKYYWHARNVYSLVYGQMLNMSQMKMISVLRRKANKTNKQVISQVLYNNIKHQVEYIKQQKQNNQYSYFMNIYQTQKGSGINQQIEINQDQYKIIKYQPFYNYYSFYKGKIISFKDHYDLLSVKELYYVKRFIKVMNRYNPRNGLIKYKKIEYVFNYDSDSHIKNKPTDNLRFNKINSNKQSKQKRQKKQSVIECIFLIKIHELPEFGYQQLKQQPKRQQRKSNYSNYSNQFNKKIQQPLNKQNQQNNQLNKVQQRDDINDQQADMMNNQSNQVSNQSNMVQNQSNINHKTNQFNYIKRNSIQPIQQTKRQSQQQNISKRTINSKISIQSYKQNKSIQITIQKVSKNHYHNQIYNFPIYHKQTLLQSQYDQQVLLKQLMTNQMNQIFNKYNQQIITIQKYFRRHLAIKKCKQIKQSHHIQTYINQHNQKYILYTLIINHQTQKSIFFIQNIQFNQLSIQNQSNPSNILSNTSNVLQSTFNNYTNQFNRTNFKKKFIKNYSIFIRKQVSFTQLNFLSKIQSKLQDNQTLQDLYLKIQKYLKIKHFASKIFFKSKNIRFFTDFQTQFKKKLCFATIKNQFLFRGKMRQGKIMYMLTVKQFSKIPRPYSFRIFTLDSNSIISIDAQKTIYNKQKLFLQSKYSTINEIVQIFSRNEFEIFAKVKAQAMKKVSSRISIISNYSFQSGVDSTKDYENNSHGNNGFVRRMSKNSMFAKFRHKALIRNQDLQAIKKLVEQRNMNQQDESQTSSHSSKNSIVSPVMSAEEDKQSDNQ